MKKDQYFTTNKYLKKELYSLILNNPKIILEPSIGQGDLVEYVINKNKNIIFHMYELDSNIKMLDCIKINDIVFGNFLEQNIECKYKTIIGNPPYVKTKTGNLYLNFIKKCYNLLEYNGELIFIVPSDFIKLTRSAKLINLMLKNGTFTHIITPNKENFFKNASIDIMIFRYCKNNILTNKIILNNENKFLTNTNGIITFSNENKNNYDTFEDFFDIFVGMVSGKESVYKNNEYGNVKILNGVNKEDLYILTDYFPTENTNLNKYLLKNKEILKKRKIRKFNENNWFEWGALRNYKFVKKNLGKECIYIKNLTRNNEVAFISNVKLFGGSLILLVPKKKINLKLFVVYLNSAEFKQNYMYSNRFKIGHKQLCNSLFQSSHFV